MDTKNYANAVAKAVSEAIKAGGKTQVGISEKTGIPRATLARRLSGLTPFTVAELAAIATVLEIPLTSLVTPIKKQAVA